MYLKGRKGHTDTITEDTSQEMAWASETYRIKSIIIIKNMPGEGC